MDIDITAFFTEASPRDYSASAAELGQDAGRITWAHACEDAPDYDHLDDDEKRQAFREHVKEFGAWTAEEINAWTHTELNALFLQLVSGDIRRADLDTDAPDWEAYEAGAEEGRYSGNISRDAGRVYYYLGN